MTAQIHDSVEWMGESYQLVGVNGGPMFDLLDHGVETQPTSTANWRGWVAAYAVRDDRLMLHRLDEVGAVVQPGGSPPPVNGVDPVQGAPYRWNYPDIALEIPFSGKLLIAKDFIRDLYVHMGFHPAWKWEHSWELTFEGGQLMDATDTSEEMKAVREGMAAQGGDPDVGKPGWIERTFRLSFGRSWGRPRGRGRH